MNKKIKKWLIYLGLIGLPTAVATTVSIKKTNDSIQSINEDLENIDNQLDEIKQENEKMIEELKETKESVDELVTNMNKLEEYVDTYMSTEEVELSNNDEIALDYFETLKDDVSRISSYENVEKYKESVIQGFIYLTDFIFFDGEIEGIKFKSLTNEAKAKVITTYVEIDQLMTKIYPKYKEDLSDKYDTVKEFFLELYETNLSEETKQNIEDTSDKVNEAVDLIGEYTGDIYDNAKTKVKTWYGDFKANHQ